MSNIRIKEVGTERKDVSINEAEKLVNLFTEIYPGVHFLNRLWDPFKELPSDFPDLKIIVISYKSTSQFKKYDRPADYSIDIVPELTREKTLLARTAGEERLLGSYILSFHTSNTDYELSKILKKLGFQYEKKHLHLIILAVPPEIGNFIFHKEKAILDKFEFDKSELRPVHKKKLKILIEYMHATWEKHQPAKTFNPVHDLTIIGHTDLVGGEEYNEKLGQKRAESVAEFIMPRLHRTATKIHISTIASDGESHPRVETEEKEPLNRGAEIILTYHESSVSALVRIKETILSLLEKDSNIAKTTFYKEAKCIAEKIDAFSFEDLFYPTVPDHGKWSSHLLLSLRLILLREEYKGKSDKAIYVKYKDIILEIKHAIRQANRNIVDIGGIVPPDHPNKARRKDFAFQRIVNKDPPSILGCLLSFDV